MKIKLVALFFIFLISTFSLVSSVDAIDIESGRYNYRIRYDSSGNFYSQCVNLGKGGSISGPHINFEIFKKRKKLANWHIAWDKNCLVAHDTISGSCKNFCGRKRGSGDIGTVLDILGVPNSAIKKIERNKSARREFEKIGLIPGKSPFVESVTIGGVAIIVYAATREIVKFIIKALSCLILKVCVNKPIPQDYNIDELDKEEFKDIEKEYLYKEI